MRHNIDRLATYMIGLSIEKRHMRYFGNPASNTTNDKRQTQLATRNTRNAGSMETRVPPGLYLEPPSFDIDLDDFMLLPRRRVEAIRLLREGQATEISNGSLAQQALTAGKYTNRQRVQQICCARCWVRSQYHPDVPTAVE